MPKFERRMFGYMYIKELHQLLVQITMLLDLP